MITAREILQPFFCRSVAYIEDRCFWKKGESCRHHYFTVYTQAVLAGKADWQIYLQLLHHKNL